MRLLRIVVAMLALAGIGATPAAEAGTHHELVRTPTSSNPLALARPWSLAYATVEALDAAVRYWRATPCAGFVGVEWASAVPAAIAAQRPPGISLPISAWTSFQTPGGEDDYAEPSPAFTDCVIHFPAASWAPAVIRAAPSDFCTVMVHEVGHLLGWPDSLEYAPTDVRYPVVGSTNAPAICGPWR